MRTLTVENFSCIKKASVELRRLTVIIGPQASGKSVLSKLSYFLFDCAHQQRTSLQRLHPLEKFTATLKERFVHWFPLEAWGSERFKIELSAGDYSISLTRKTYGGKVSDDFRVKFSEQFKVQYEAMLGELSKTTGKASRAEISLEYDYKIYERVSKSLAALMGRDRIDHQVFVPAGRSFFTSIGKAIAAFEQGKVLDPLIIQFGRMYTSFRESGMHWYYGEKSAETAGRKAIEREFDELLGGRIERDGELEYVRTTDGRRVPLSAMSSGQQELLPLVTVLPWLIRSRDDRLCYIEEPEAHLFPKAQSKLIEALVSAANFTALGANLVMTTHSPYVLTKINNLLKAGSISRKLSEEARKRLETILPRKSWLTARHVSAYAIREGRLVDILESDGLVNSDYLDEVSGDLSLEFRKLLELEESLA